MDALAIAEVKTRLSAGCAAVVAAKDELTRADQAIGDGDHGVGMARGFTAAGEALEAKPAETVGDLFKTIGMALLSTSGGASGAVFGTFFLKAASPLSEASLSGVGFAQALQAGLDGVMARGGARPGDKTMLDALAPATDAAATAAASDGAAAAIDAAARGAAEGAEQTKGMIAKTGKARSLGQRSLGHIDPGARSISLFLAAFAAGDMRAT